MNWNLIGGSLYVLIVIVVCLRVIFETHSTNKTLAYLLLCLFMPIVGMIFYLVFGINYWRIRKYRKKSAADTKILQHLAKDSEAYKESSINFADEAVQQNAELVSMVLKDLG